MLSLPDAALVQLEPNLPGIATLLDLDAFLAALQRALPHLALRGGQITYVKYKPGTSLLAAYQVQLATAPLWLYAIAYAEDEVEKVRKAARAQDVRTAIGPGCVVLEALALVIYAFPNDRKLTALHDLATVPKQVRLLQKLAPDTPALWHGQWLDLRYKPERRYVVRVQGSDQQALLKFYTPPDYANACRSAKVFRADGPLHIATRLGRSQTKQAMLLEWLPGHPLDKVLQQGRETLPELAVVGEALARLHVQKPNGLMRYTSKMEAEHVRIAAEALVAICPELTRQAAALADRLAKRFRQLNFSRCSIHGDFSADQVLLMDDGKVAILDLDNAGRGDPMADLGTFAAQLEFDGLIGLLPQARVAIVLDAIQTGYRNAAPHHFDPERLRNHTAARLLRLAVEPFRQRTPDWHILAAAILQRAEEINYA